MKKHKCKAKDCKRKVEKTYKYCSIECACYDGAFSVRTGPKIKEGEWFNYGKE